MTELHNDINAEAEQVAEAVAFADAVIADAERANEASAVPGASHDVPAASAEAVIACAKRGKVPVAVFDFDGTSMRGNSPVLLVRELIFSLMISPIVALRIGFWALAYKMRLPQNEAWVRGEVFKAFCGKKVEDVDNYLRNFYDNVVAQRVRPQMVDIMREYSEAGIIVLVISASFEPIILRAGEFLPFDGQVSTRMKVAPDGTYTREVDGLPIEGDAKPDAIRRWCDANIGAGQWEVLYAYGDHHSDTPMLEMATVDAFAVDPDHALARVAKSRGWTVLEY